MTFNSETRCIAFAGFRRIAAGKVSSVAAKTKAALESGEREPVLIFDEATSRLVEIDFRGTADDVSRRIKQQLRSPQSSEFAPEPSQADSPAIPRGPGRPKLGVVPREVTLLPRHWDWLAAQPGGASVALRKLVEEARRGRRSDDLRRQAQESAYRFLHAIAGDLADFEEVSRALFAFQAERFDELTQPWPRDVRDHARKLARASFAAAPACA
jgi:hypothetical protein